MDDVKDFERYLKTKICSNPKCIYFGNPQTLDHFGIRSDRRIGYQSRCRTCQSQYEKDHHAEILERKRKQKVAIAAIAW